MCPEVVPPLQSHVPHGIIGQLTHSLHVTVKHSGYPGLRVN